MNINPAQSALQNIVALTTDPALGQPTNPAYLAAGTPMPYDPNATVSTNGPVYGQGVNVDGENSNTYVIVFLRPGIEDAAEDGVSQKVMYQRKTLEQIVGGVSTNVVLPSGINAIMVLSTVALLLGLIATEVEFTSSFIGEPASINLTVLNPSLLYLPSTITLNLTYA